MTSPSSPVKKPSWPKRLLKKVAYVLGVMIFMLGSLELFMRFYISYNPGYYVGFQDKRSTVVHYPYGDIKFNSIGAPDDEFDATKTRPRIAYVGDSVCFGVGAGHGYRVTEQLDQLLPQYEHMNMSGGPGSNGVGEALLARMQKRIDDYQIDAVVYILNLNDILPDVAPTDEPQVEAAAMRGRLAWLRRDSYLFNFLRTTVKTFYMRKGYSHNGMVAFELFPDKYQDILTATANRINHFAEELGKKGVKFVVVLSPYEMQISSQAEKKYGELGFTWGPTFIDRGPQRALIAAFHGDFQVVDAYEAFVDPTGKDADRTRDKNALGDLFVYNLGDRLDWNHPNRKGHALMAQQIFRSGVLQRAVAR